MFEQIRDTLRFLDKWEDRYAYIIELGASMPKIHESKRTNNNKVSGCMSQVWIYIDNDCCKHKSSNSHGRSTPALQIDQLTSCRLNFVGDSDAYIVKGLLQIIFSYCKNKTIKEILEMNPRLILEELGLNEYISVGRTNGFFSVSNKIKELAKLYSEAMV